MPSPTIYTVGYSTHEWASLVALLNTVPITAVADVRSHPTARLPQYRRENLAVGLRAEGVAYVFLGDQLGARRQEAECYVDGRADYERVAELPAFGDGIARLTEGVADYTVALMCAEREPLDCHRGVLIARVLQERGWRVRHLLADGTMEEHARTEERLVAQMGVDPLLDAGMDPRLLRERAYKERGREIAYRLPDLPGPVDD
ncbi:MAG: DUF488 domain-containing protein [Planctomycetota bacterium]